MLDIESLAVLEEIRKLNSPPLSTVDVLTLRETMKARPRLEGPAIFQVVDGAATGPRGEIPLRVYRPGPESKLPVLVWLHGGGFTFCDIEMYDPLCRHLAEATGWVIVSVDYCLAPEFPFPAPAEDAYAAVQWISRNAQALDVDADRLVVGGDSAGGTLAMVVAQMARDRDGPLIAFQVLVYGSAEMVISNPELGDLPILTNDSCEWFWDHYVPDRSRRSEPYCSPILAEDLSGLPPAFILTAEHDPTRDASERYGHLLAAAGVRSTMKRYPGTFHGFFSMTTLLSQARLALADVALVLNGNLSTFGKVGHDAVVDAGG